MKLFKTAILFLLATSMAQAQLVVTAAVNHTTPNGIDSLGSISLNVTGSTAPYTYSWTPNNVTTQNLTSIRKGKYTVKVKSASGDSLSYSYNLGYKVQWTNLGPGAWLGHDTLTGIACSKNSLRPYTDGWFEYVENTMNSSSYYIGFIDSLSPLIGATTDIDYGIYSYAGAYLYYYENGNTNFISYPAKGNVVRIERAGDTIRYKINGVTLRSVTVPGVSGKTLKLKAFIYSPMTLINVGCSFMGTDNTTFKNYVKVIPIISHSNGPGTTNGSISLSPKLGGTDTYTWQPGGSTNALLSRMPFGTYTVTVKDSLSNTSTYRYNVDYKVQWTNLSSGSYLGHDTLMGIACSKNTLRPGQDGYMEYVETNFNYIGRHSFIGFVDSLSPLQGVYSDIDYGFFCYRGTDMYYYESGSAGYMAPPVEGDVVRLERIGNVINYKINGVTLRSVTVPGISAKALKLKAFIYSPMTLINVGCSFMSTDSAAFKNYVNVNPTIIHSSGPGISDGSIALSPQLGGAHSYTWQPGGGTGATLSGLSAGIYTVTVKDSLSNTSTFRYNVDYKTKWTNLNNCVLQHDSLIGNPAYGQWSRANSKNVLPPGQDGWVEYVNTASYSLRTFGLLDSLYDNLYYYDIRYGFYFDINSNYVYSFVNGSFLVIYNTPAIGDVFRLERVGNSVNFKINGVLLQTVSLASAPGKPWQVKGVMYRSNIMNLGMSRPGMELANMVTQDIQCIPSQSTGSAVATTSGGKAPVTFTWDAVSSGTVSTITGLAAGVHTVQAADADGYTISQTFTISQCPAWTTTTTPLSINTTGDVTKSGGVNGWDDAYLFTSQPFRFKDTTAWISFDVADTVSSYMLGFRSVGGDSIAQPSNYKFYIENAIASLVETDNDGFYNKMQIARVNPGSHVMIQLGTAGIAYYRSVTKDSPYELVYTSRLFSPMPLIVEGILNRTGSRVNHIRVSGNGN